MLWWACHLYPRRLCRVIPPTLPVKIFSFLSKAVISGETANKAALGYNAMRQTGVRVVTYDICHSQETELNIAGQSFLVYRDLE